MRKLITAALLLAATIGAPTVASARDRDGWRDRDRDHREWRDDHWRDRRDWRRDRDEWRHDRWADRRDRYWRERQWRRYADRGVVCRTFWDRWGYPERVCFRR